jgi:hypothetical protein
MKQGVPHNTESKPQRKYAMQTADILMTQKSWHIEITNEDNAHHFL